MADSLAIGELDSEVDAIGDSMVSEPVEQALSPMAAAAMIPKAPATLLYVRFMMFSLLRRDSRRRSFSRPSGAGSHEAFGAQAQADWNLLELLIKSVP